MLRLGGQFGSFPAGLDRCQCGIQVMIISRERGGGRIEQGRFQCVPTCVLTCTIARGARSVKPRAELITPRAVASAFEFFLVGCQGHSIVGAGVGLWNCHFSYGALACEEQYGDGWWILLTAHDFERRYKRQDEQKHCQQLPKAPSCLAIVCQGH